MIGKKDTVFNGVLLQVGMVVLWLLTSALAVWEIMVVRALAVRVTIKVLMDSAGLSLIMANVWAYRVGAVTALLMGLVALVIVLGGLDLKLDRIGRFPAWKVLLWVLGGELAVLVISFLV